MRIGAAQIPVTNNVEDNLKNILEALKKTQKRSTINLMPWKKSNKKISRLQNKKESLLKKKKHRITIENNEKKNDCRLKKGAIS